MVIGLEIARLATGKTSVTAVRKEVILKEIAIAVLKVSGCPFNLLLAPTFYVNSFIVEKPAILVNWLC